MSDWGQGAKNNDIGWGQGAVNNDISWGAVHSESWSGDTDIVGEIASTEYFVRQSGTTYGDGSGTSYANAWSGFSSINWTLLANKTLNVCGTFNELLLVQNSDVTIVGNNVLGAGIINGQSARRCLFLEGYNNIIINGLSMINGLEDNILIKQTTGTIFNNCVFDTSTNQTVQHEGANLSSLIEVTYNNCTFKNGVDDGVSLHGNNTTLVLNNCSMENNSQGVNAINASVCIINDCNFMGNITDIQPDSASNFTANRCTFRGQLTANSSVPLKVNNCLMLNGNTFITGIGHIIVQDTKFMGLSKITTNQADISKVIITRCYFEVSTVAKITNYANSVFDVAYSTFRHVSETNIEAISTVSGTGTSVINNCNFIGSANKGWGIVARSRVNVKNSIFSLLNLCVNPNGVSGIVSFDYCNTYLNTTINVNQGGGAFTNTNNIITNPLFANIATLDFRLQAGSGSLNSGATLTNATGILSADWVSSIPTVTTINQSGTWDRGAYVQ